MAVITAEEAAVRVALAVTWNVADVAPAGTVTVDGTVATFVLDEAKLTTTPPVGATIERVTVPVEADPIATEVGLRTKFVRVGTWL